MNKEEKNAIVEKVNSILSNTDCVRDITIVIERHEGEVPYIRHNITEAIFPDSRTPDYERGSVTGEWVQNADENQRIDPPYFCSECGHANLRKTPYCEMCGMKALNYNKGECNNE